MNAPSFLRLALPWKRRRLAGQFRRARTLEADAPFVPRSAPKRISGSSLAIVFLAQILAAPHRLYGQTQAATNSPAPGEIRIVTLAELVEISPAGASSWIRIQTAQTVHPGDRIRTGPKSRAILRWSDQSIVSMDE